MSDATRGLATDHTTPRECFRDVSTGAAMMSLAAPVASAVPRASSAARVPTPSRTRARLRSVPVGARRILRSRSARARVTSALPRDGRARAGQDPGGAHRERRVHAVHAVPPAVGPEQPAGHHQERRPAKYVPYLATSPTTRRDAPSLPVERFDCVSRIRTTLRRASLRTRPPRIAFSTAPRAATRAFRAPRLVAHARAHRADR